MKRKLSVSERVEIARQLISSVSKFREILLTLSQLVKTEPKHQYPNVIDVNKRGPDKWS
ncbi:hypothetical protein Lepto7376_3689 [[Leptolyngbya] sp. PCC 7376]|nr:hypothetical protein Lepto7376_3689 [[Leptolyngbya] sp. PCC 7376]